MIITDLNEFRQTKRGAIFLLMLLFFRKTQRSCGFENPAQHRGRIFKGKVTWEIATPHDEY